MDEPDLADLMAFVAVAQARSFRGAATKRGVSASALSDALRRLEARLGVRLLNRTTRSVTPTDAGARLLERLTPALSEVSAAVDEVGSLHDRPAGTVRLNVPTFVARVVLPPIACRFLAAHPAITLDIEANDTFIDVLAAGFDAGIRYSERLERDMIAVPIGPAMQRYACAAAPAYLAERGTPQTPHDVLDHVSIRHRFASGVMFPWEFERSGETVMVSPPARLIASTLDIELDGALAGLGLICSFEDYLRPHLASGALVPVLTDWWPSFTGPRLYFANRALMPPALRAFVDFVKADRDGR